MKRKRHALHTQPVLDARGVSLRTPAGRLLISELSLVLGREHAALIGRNGVGKSSLLRTLGGEGEPAEGVVTVNGVVQTVTQVLPGGERVHHELRSRLHNLGSNETLSRECAAAGVRKECLEAGLLSPGELRTLSLLVAKLEQPDLLLLDEPTQDLDEPASSWLKSWLPNFSGALIAVSHDPRLLKLFQSFFILEEAGGRIFHGSYESVCSERLKLLERAIDRQRRNSVMLERREAKISHVARRRKRKKQYGRASELDRATPRQRLNQKRDYAQVKHGRMASIRRNRKEELRAQMKEFRRSAPISLALNASFSGVQQQTLRTVVSVESLGAICAGRILFRDFTETFGRERLAVLGANGSGKSTLLEIIAGRRRPSEGTRTGDDARIAYIGQYASESLDNETLEELLQADRLDQKKIDDICASHHFPPALAKRPIRTLSPGEQLRAKLIALMHRNSPIDLLILDEPTASLDLLGQESIRELLNEWGGGLIVATHDHRFLSGLHMDRHLIIDRDRQRVLSSKLRS